MSYTVKSYDGNTATSKVDIGLCHACDKAELVQKLPAVLDAGQLLSVNLCKACLLRLVSEIETNGLYWPDNV